MEFTVPATSANLGPGFDTLGLAIDLKNRVVIKRAKFFSISIKGEGENNYRLKTNNKFISIFYEIYKEITNSRDNFRFEFYNNIPLARGMGSSSAIIVSAIGAAYAMAKIVVPKEKILNKALIFENHPDNISPAVYGGFTVSIVDNGKVFVKRKEIPSYLKAVMVIPDRAMSTSLSRKALPKYYKMQDIVFNISHSSFLTAAFLSEDWEMLKRASKDRIHQKYRMENMRELFEVQKIALKNGALMSTLSGSGSSFFNLVYEEDAKRVRDSLKNSFPNFRVEIFDLDNVGFRIEKGLKSSI